MDWNVLIINYGIAGGVIVFTGFSIAWAGKRLLGKDGILTNVSARHVDFLDHVEQTQQDISNGILDIGSWAKRSSEEFARLTALHETADSKFSTTRTNRALESLLVLRQRETRVMLKIAEKLNIEGEVKPHIEDITRMIDEAVSKLSNDA